MDVTGTTAGAKNNTTSAVTSTEGGTGGTASASLTVVAAADDRQGLRRRGHPGGRDDDADVHADQPERGTALTGVGFTDALPAGLVVATPNGLAGTCGGTVTAVAGGGSIGLANEALAAGGSCTIAVDVTGTSGGLKDNTTSAVTSTEGGTGGVAVAFLVVVPAPAVAPPTIAKAFGAASIVVNGTTTLTFTLTNPNPGIALTGVGFTDTLPAGLVVATPNGLANTCGGTVTAVAGSGSVGLANGGLPAGGSCTITVSVTGTTAGAKNNTTSAVTSTEGGAGGTASASLRVLAAAGDRQGLRAAGDPDERDDDADVHADQPERGDRADRRRLDRPAARRPRGGHPERAGQHVRRHGHRGRRQRQRGAGQRRLARRRLLHDHGRRHGHDGRRQEQHHERRHLDRGRNGRDRLGVPRGVSRSGGSADVRQGLRGGEHRVNGTTTLTFTLTNPNPGTGLTGVSFTDPLPGGLVVATPNGLASTCGGTVTAVEGAGSVGLANGVLPAGGSCTITVSVTGTTAGAKDNTTSAVTSIEGGTGGTAAASLEVLAPPTIAKAFGAASVVVNETTTLTFLLTNPNPATALTGVGFTDLLPAGLVVATPNGLTGACGGGTITATAGDTAVGLTGATLGAGGLVPVRDRRPGGGYWRSSQHHGRGHVRQRRRRRCGDRVDHRRPRAGVDRGDPHAVDVRAGRSRALGPADRSTTNIRDVAPRVNRRPGPQRKWRRWR